MVNLILPKNYVQNIDSPLIFLAGPIKGAPSWQNEAVKIIHSLEPNFFVASPSRRMGKEVAGYVVSGDSNYFQRQRAWEWHYMSLAAKKGCILFWLPGEIQHSCDKSYAFMTSNEFGHWTAYKQWEQVNLAIGRDGNFREWSTLEFDLKKKVPEMITNIKETLEDTCKEAIKISKG
jgi:hypothetical protein